MEYTVTPGKKVRQGYFKKQLSKQERRDRRQLKERGYMPR